MVLDRAVPPRRVLRQILLRRHAEQHVNVTSGFFRRFRGMDHPRQLGPAAKLPLRVEQARMHESHSPVRRTLLVHRVRIDHRYQRERAAALLMLEKCRKRWRQTRAAVESAEILGDRRRRPADPMYATDLEVLRDRL